MKLNINQKSCYSVRAHLYDWPKSDGLSFQPFARREETDSFVDRQADKHFNREATMGPVRATCAASQDFMREV